MLGQVGTRNFARCSTKPTTVDAVVGVLYELSGDQLTDFTGADDDGVLLEGRTAAARLPRSHS
jgi:hypothetical protein